MALTEKASLMNTKYVHPKIVPRARIVNTTRLFGGFRLLQPSVDIPCFELGAPRRSHRNILFTIRTRFEKDTDELKSEKRHPSFRGGFWEERRGCESRQRVRFQNPESPRSSRIMSEREYPPAPEDGMRFDGEALCEMCCVARNGRGQISACACRDTWPGSRRVRTPCEFR